MPVLEVLELHTTQMMVADGPDVLLIVTLQLARSGVVADLRELRAAGKV